MNKDIELRKQMGERITEIRKQLNLTKESLAKEMGISGQFLGIVEKGGSDISYDKLKKLCDISGYSADYILFGKSDEKRKEVIIETKELLNEFSEEQIVDACDIIKKIANFMKNNNEN